jgi:hypothetical protein
LATSDGWIHLIETSTWQVEPLFQLPGVVELSAAGQTQLMRTGAELLAFE